MTSTTPAEITLEQQIAHLEKALREYVPTDDEDTKDVATGRAILESLKHYAAIREALDWSALEAGAQALEADARNVRPDRFTLIPEIQLKRASSLRNLKQVAEGGK